MAAWIKLEGRLPVALSPILCSLKTLSTLNTAAVGCGVTLCDDGTPRVFVTLPWYVDNNPWDAVQKPLLLSVLVAGADPMLALLTGRESPDTPSLWQAWEFQQASEMLESHNLGAFCTGGGAGFTATFQVEASGFNQAMLEVRSMSHPTVGGGVASRLRLPQTLSSESAYWRVANALNLAEVHSGLTAPHIGAWGVDRRGTYLLELFAQLPA